MSVIYLTASFDTTLIVLSNNLYYKKQKIGGRPADSYSVHRGYDYFRIYSNTITLECNHDHHNITVWSNLVFSLQISCKFYILVYMLDTSFGRLKSYLSN